MKRRSFVAALTLVLGACTSSTMTMAQSSCYPKGIPMPPTSSQTIVLVDLTTPASANAVKSLRAAVKAAAAQPGQRVVMLTFAGISGTERLTPVFDEIVQAKIEDNDLIETLPIRAFKRSQDCVDAANKAWPAKVQAGLSEALPRSTAPFQRSEIIHALAETLRNFAEPGLATRLIVFSDGLQYGSGISFYGLDKLPRKIDADKELAKLPSTMSKPPMPVLGKVRVFWSGLLLDDRGEEPAQASKGAYFDAETLEQLRQYWSRLLIGWGAQDVQIERELLNPRFEAEPVAKGAERGNHAKPRVVARFGL